MHATDPVARALSEAELSSASSLPTTVTPPPFKPTSELLGEWTGTIRTWERDVPFTLVVEPDGDVPVRPQNSMSTPADGTNGVID